MTKMAIKVKPNTEITEITENNETALTTVDQYLPGVTADQLHGASNPDSRLPRLKIVEAIEIDPAKGILPAHAYQIGLMVGDQFQPLPDNSIVTVISSRDAVRRLEGQLNGAMVIIDSNNPAHKQIQANYNSAYKALGVYNKTNEQFEQGLKDPTYQRGSTYLVAVIKPDGSSCIAELPAFKTKASYWARPLAQAHLTPNKFGVQLTSTNHAANLKQSKTDATKRYLDPNKFVQYKIVEMTKENMVAIFSAMETTKSEMQSWFDR
jgi:hypothetical protein